MSVQATLPAGYVYNTNGKIVETSTGKEVTPESLGLTLNASTGDTVSLSSVDVFKDTAWEGEFNAKEKSVIESQVRTNGNGKPVVAVTKVGNFIYINQSGQIQTIRGMDPTGNFASGQGYGYLDDVTDEELAGLNGANKTDDGRFHSITEKGGDLVNIKKLLDADLSSMDISALKSLSQEIQGQIDAIDARIAILDEKIEELEKQVNKAIDDAIEQAGKTTEKVNEELKNNSAKSVAKWVNDYKNGAISYEAMQTGMARELTDLGAEAGIELKSAIGNLFTANGLMEQLKAVVEERGLLVSARAQLVTKKVDVDGKIKEAEDKAAAEAAAAAAAQEPARCDPIGFELDNVKYEFFYDYGEGLTDSSQFLGSGNNWEEMTALDTTGDQAVSTEELAAATKTDGDKVGTLKLIGSDGSIKEISEFEEMSINLGSYTGAGYNGKEGNKGDVLNTDIAGNQLFGNFTMSIGDQEGIQGWNTNDTEATMRSNYKDYFEENNIDFKFTAAANPMTTNEETVSVPDEKQAQLEEMVKQLEEKLNNAWLTITGEERFVEEVITLTKQSNDLTGQIAQIDVDAEKTKTEETKTEDAAKDETVEPAEEPDMEDTIANLNIVPTPEEDKDLIKPEEAFV